MRYRYAALVLTGSLLLCTEPSIAVAQSAPIARYYSRSLRRAQHRGGAALRHTRHWIRAVPGAENAGDVRVISSMGAISLMQLMPDTRATLCIRRRLGRDPQDPRDNVFAGTAYLPEMWDRYGNVAAMLAAYNAGPDRYDEHRSTGRPLPAETRAYVAALLPVVTGAAASEAPDRKSPLPPDWREAPLFAIRPDGMRRCSPYARTACGSPIPGQTIGRFGDARATVPARNRRTAEPQDGSRFVARASNGGSP